MCNVWIMSQYIFILFLYNNIYYIYFYYLLELDVSIQALNKKERWLPINATQPEHVVCKYQRDKNVLSTFHSHAVFKTHSRYQNEMKTFLDIATLNKKNIVFIHWTCNACFVHRLRRLRTVLEHETSPPHIKCCPHNLVPDYCFASRPPVKSGK